MQRHVALPKNFSIWLLHHVACQKFFLIIQRDERRRKFLERLKKFCYNPANAVPLQAVTQRLRREVKNMTEILVEIGKNVVGIVIGGLIVN